MSSPIHDGSISPNDPGYYAPRRPNGNGKSPLTDQFSAPSTFSTPDNGNARTEETEVIVPFPRAREYLNDFKQGTRKTWRTTALVVCGVAVVLTGAMALFGSANIAPQVSEKRSPQESALSLASRLQTAAVDIQKASQQVVTPTLVVNESAGDTNAPLALGLEIKNFTPGATIALSGLPPGTSVSKGAAEPDGRWRLPVAQLSDVKITPPSGYDGVMTIIAELRTGSDLPIVRSPVRLTWHSSPAFVPITAPASGSTGQAATSEKTTTPTPPARHLDPKEVAALLHRAEELKAAGDVAAARLLLQRVAETNNARAAFELAETYDPVAMKKFGGTSVAADPALAQYWYQRARDGKAPATTQDSEAIASRTTAGSN